MAALIGVSAPTEEARLASAGEGGESNASDELGERSAVREWDALALTPADQVGTLLARFEARSSRLLGAPRGSALYRVLAAWSGARPITSTTRDRARCAARRRAGVPV
jgi:hypothetical protein